MLLRHESKLANSLILGAAATSFSWASVSVFIHATLLHRTFCALRSVKIRLSNGPFKQKGIAHAWVKRKMTAVAPIWFSDMKVYVSLD